MRPPNEEVIRILIGQWLYKAETDLRTAESLLCQDPPFLFPSCFHSQQAAEKYVKAYLTWRQLDFPKTHSIALLLDLAAAADEDMATKLQPAVELTPYGVDIRYPGDQPEPNLERTRKAVALARMVRDAILPLLPQALHEGPDRE